MSMESEFEQVELRFESRELGFVMCCGGGGHNVWTALAKARSPMVQCSVQVMAVGVSGLEMTSWGIAVEKVIRGGGVIEGLRGDEKFGL